MAVNIKQKINNILPAAITWEFVFLAVTLGTIFVLICGINISFIDRVEVPFSWLADSFLHGKFHFLDDVAKLCQDQKTAPVCYDFSFYDGKYFLALGPMPAIVMMPLVLAFGNAFPDFILAIPLNIINFLLVMGIAKRMGVKRTIDAAWLGVFYLFGTVYFGMSIFGSMWHIGHTMGTAFLFGAIYEFFGKRRWWLVGLLTGFAGLTRLTMFGSAVFFGLYMLFERGPVFLQKLKNLASFSTLCAASLFFVFYYNFARFGAIMEGGYTYQALIPILEHARSFGLVSLRHLPGNIFAFLFQGLEAVRSADQPGILEFPYYHVNFWGLSILFTSPVLLMVFLAPWKKTIVKCIWAGIVVTAIPIFTYYGVGFIQAGYRYALDFYPLLLMLLLIAIAGRLSFRAKALIFSGVAVNFFINAELIVFILKNLKP